MIVMRGSKIYRLLSQVDWILVASIVALTVIGAAFVYSAGYRSGEVALNPYFRKQLVWLAVGWGVFFLMAFTDYHWCSRHSLLIYLFSLAMLVVVLFFGKRIYGATRWLSLFGMQVQPSELAKLAVTIAIASFVSNVVSKKHTWETLAKGLLLMVIPFVLIAKEPDLGTALVLVPITLVVLYVGGMSVKKLFLLGAAGVMALPVVWLSLNAYQRDRILVFFEPGRDPLGAGWNNIQSMIAVGAGGMWGKGFLMGTQNILGFLPRSVSPTDFIYPVIAEEMGFMGSLVIVSLFLVLLICCVRAAIWSRDTFGRLLVVGIVVLMFCHIFLNLAMTIGLAPITGVPLPLISYGGSFMVSVMAALGLVQSVYVRRSVR